LFAAEAAPTCSLDGTKCNPGFVRDETASPDYASLHPGYGTTCSQPGWNEVTKFNPIEFSTLRCIRTTALDSEQMVRTAHPTFQVLVFRHREPFRRVSLAQDRLHVAISLGMGRTLGDCFAALILLICVSSTRKAGFYFYKVSLSSKPNSRNISE